MYKKLRFNFSMVLFITVFVFTSCYTNKQVDKKKKHKDKHIQNMFEIIMIQKQINFELPAKKILLILIFESKGEINKFFDIYNLDETKTLEYIENVKNKYNNTRIIKNRIDNKKNKR